MGEHKETASFLRKKELEEEILALMRLSPRSSLEKTDAEKKILEFVKKIKGADDQDKKCLVWAICGVLSRINEFSSESLGNLRDLFLRLDLSLDICKKCFDCVKALPIDKDIRWAMFTVFLRTGVLLLEDIRFILDIAVSRLKEGDDPQILIQIFNEIGIRYTEKDAKKMWEESLSFLKVALDPKLFEEVKRELEDFFGIEIK